MSCLGGMLGLLFVGSQRNAAPLARRFGFASASTSPTGGRGGAGAKLT